MSQDAYDRLGAVPDVAQGENLVHILELGSFSPVFSLTPDQAVRFADRVSRAAGRVREEHRHGHISRQDRDEHLHLLERPPQRESTWTDRRPSRLWTSLLIGATAVVVVLIVWAFATRVTS